MVAVLEDVTEASASGVREEERTKEKIRVVTGGRAMQQAVGIADFGFPCELR